MNSTTRRRIALARLVVEYDPNCVCEGRGVRFGWLRIRGCGYLPASGWERVPDYATEWYVPLTDPIWAIIAPDRFEETHA